jgi:two-component system CheB/CheR fusion protein
MAAAIGALVYIARQRSLAQRRMERLLQFTSHELKTPISGVRALLQSLGLGSLPEERKAEFLKRGLLEVDRLEHLTETILAWQRSLASEGRVAPAAHEASSLVNQILEHRSRTGVTETLDVKPVAPAQVLVDADAFRVILENLLDNAHKYGGGRAEVFSEVRGREWALSVKDGGQGFAASQAENLFDPFRRQKHEGVTHGSGLGLYLSRQLAQRMNGRLTASSEGPGRGSIFTVTLLVSEAAARG